MRLEFSIPNSIRDHVTYFLLYSLLFLRMIQHNWITCVLTSTRANSLQCGVSQHLTACEIRGVYGTEDLYGSLLGYDTMYSVISTLKMEAVCSF